MTEERNVLGESLEPCGTDPMTGFYRDGSCTCGEEDVGLHAVCAVVTEEFLLHQRAVGNDLTTPMPLYQPLPRSMIDGSAATVLSQEAGEL